MDTITKTPDLGYLVVDDTGVDTVYLAILAASLAKGTMLTYDNRPESYLQIAQGCVPLKYFNVSMSHVCTLAGFSAVSCSHIPYEWNEHFKYIHRFMRLLPTKVQHWVVRLATEYSWYTKVYPNENEESKKHRLYRMLNHIL